MVDKEILISIIMACRGDVASINENLLSLLESAKHPENIEVLVRFDNDDKDTIDVFSNMNFIKDYNIRIFNGIRHGYTHAEKYHNELAEKSSGKIIMLWGGTVRMETHGWDEKLYPYIDDFCMIEPSTKIKILVLGDTGEYRKKVENLVPIITRNIYDIFGYFAPVISDGWLRQLCGFAGIVKYVDIDIRVVKKMVKLSSEETLKRHLATNYFKSPEMTDRMREDVKKLIRYIKDHNIEYTEDPFVHSSFLDGIYVEIFGFYNKKCLIEIENCYSNKIICSHSVLPFNWFACDFHENHIGRKIKVSCGGNLVFERLFDLKGQKILFYLKTEAKEDINFAIPLIKKFGMKNQCEIVILTEFYDQYDSKYPEIDFRPLEYLYNDKGTINDEIYASYRVGEDMDFRENLINVLI